MKLKDIKVGDKVYCNRYPNWGLLPMVVISLLNRGIIRCEHPLNGASNFLSKDLIPYSEGREQKLKELTFLHSQLKQLNKILFKEWS